MQRKRDGLVPIGEAISGLGGPVKAIREASPQALRHFTQADQVNQLVGASEADPDLGFMARLLALCALPRAPTPATGFFTNASTARTGSTCRPGRKTSSPSAGRVAFRVHAGSWISTAPAAEAGESGHGFATR